MEDIYQRAVCSKTMPPRVPVMGITILTISLLVSFVPESCDRQYPTATIRAISIAPRPITRGDPDAAASVDMIYYFRDPFIVRAVPNVEGSDETT